MARRAADLPQECGPWSALGSVASPTPTTRSRRRCPPTWSAASSPCSTRHPAVTSSTWAAAPGCGCWSRWRPGLTSPRSVSTPPCTPSATPGPEPSALPTGWSGSRRMPRPGGRARPTRHPTPSSASASAMPSGVSTARSTRSAATFAPVDGPCSATASGSCHLGRGTAGTRGPARRPAHPGPARGDHHRARLRARIRAQQHAGVGRLRVVMDRVTRGVGAARGAQRRRESAGARCRTHPSARMARGLPR